MALVEEYYELNEAEEVSVVWKLIQIGAYLCAGCLGLWCSYTMALIRTRLEDKCYLYTRLKYDSGSDLINHIDWEGEFWCDYCQYTMVSSFIIATIWATFFLMCGKGGKSLTGLPQPWRIVSCSLIFNIIYFFVTLSASIKIQQGTEAFCEHQHHTGLYINMCLHHCRPLDVIYSTNSKLIGMTSLHLEIVVKTSWCCTFSWLILILIPFFRIVFAVDFRMYKICVFQIDETIHNKKEEVLKITNYEEPKKLYANSIQEKTVHYFDDENLDDLERGGKSIPESEKKSQQFRWDRSPLQPNAAFYVTADIRMLNRERKRKKIRVLDEVFESNEIHRGKKFRVSDEMQSPLEDPGTSHPTRFLYRYSNLLFEPTGNKNSEASKSIARTEDERRLSDSDDSVLVNRSEILKKQV